MLVALQAVSTQGFHYFRKLSNPKLYETMILNSFQIDFLIILSEATTFCQKFYNVKKTEDAQKQVRIGRKRSLLREIFFSGQGNFFFWAGKKIYLPRASIGELFHNRHNVKLFCAL